MRQRRTLICVAEEGLLAQAAIHVCRDHGLESVPDELIAAVRARIVDAD
jgi:predicted small metal-binding protein